MMFRESIVVAVLIVTLSHANPIHDQRKCVIEHLQNKELLDSSYGEPHNLTYCKSLITTSLALEYGKVGGKLQNLNDETNVTDCIVDEVKANNYVEYRMREYIYETDGTKTVEQLQKELETNRKIYQEILLRARVKCSQEENFGKFFDELYNEDTSDDDDDDDEEDDEDVDYCLRKYIVETNLIDSNVFTLNSNPKNIDVSEIDCVVLTQKAKKTVGDIIRKIGTDNDALPDESNCIEQKFIANNFSDQMILTSFLIELKLNEQQLAVYRKNFVDMLINITVEYSICSMTTDE